MVLGDLKIHLRSSGPRSRTAAVPGHCQPGTGLGALPPAPGAPQNAAGARAGAGGLPPGSRPAEKGCEPGTGGGGGRNGEAEGERKKFPAGPGSPSPAEDSAGAARSPHGAAPRGPGPARGRSLTLRLHLLPPPRSGARRAAASRAGLRGYKGGRRARGVGFLSLPLQLHRAVRRRQRDEAPLKAAEAGGAPAARLGTARPGRGGERRGAEGMGSPRRPGASCPQAAAGR